MVLVPERKLAKSETSEFIALSLKSSGKSSESLALIS